VMVLTTILSVYLVMSGCAIAFLLYKTDINEGEICRLETRVIELEISKEDLERQISRSTRSNK